MVAPIAFAGLSWLRFKRFVYTRPLTTALLFLAVVFALDVFFVARACSGRGSHSF